MISSHELLIKLAEHGVKLFVEKGRLRYCSHETVSLPDDLRQAIRMHKPALTVLVQEGSEAKPPASEVSKNSEDIQNDGSLLFRAPCSTCGDHERWPTTKGEVCPTCFLNAHTKTHSFSDEAASLADTSISNASPSLVDHTDLIRVWHNATDSEKQQFVAEQYDDLVEVAQACRAMAKLPRAL